MILAYHQIGSSQNYYKTKTCSTTSRSYVWSRLYSNSVAIRGNDKPLHILIIGQCGFAYALNGLRAPWSQAGEHTASPCIKPGQIVRFWVRLIDFIGGTSLCGNQRIHGSRTVLDHELMCQGNHLGRWVDQGGHIWTWCGSLHHDLRIPAIHIHKLSRHLSAMEGDQYPEMASILEIDI